MSIKTGPVSWSPEVGLQVFWASFNEVCSGEVVAKSQPEVCMANERSTNYAIKKKNGTLVLATEKDKLRETRAEALRDLAKRKQDDGAALLDRASQLFVEASKEQR